MKNNWIYQALLIALSGVASWFIAMARPDLNNLEIGAIANQAFPIMLGGISLVVYGIYMTVKKKPNFNFCLFLVVLNLAFGIYLYLHK